MTRDKARTPAKKKLPPGTIVRLPPGHRGDAAEPWRYGPYRVVVQRRVTEEEQCSLECYEPTFEEARATYSAMMETMRTEMVEYNERVFKVNQAKLKQLDAMIEARAENVHRLDAAIKERRDWLLEHGTPASDVPIFEDGAAEE